MQQTEKLFWKDSMIAQAVYGVFDAGALALMIKEGQL